MLAEAKETPTRRAAWTFLTDAQLLNQCAVDTYRASGPGGQKRNKTSSAVRMRHLPSGLIVIAEESRSQHENRARALRRMRQALYLKIREEIPAPATAEKTPALSDEIRSARNAAGRLDLGKKDPRFWPAAAFVLDVLQAAQGRIGDTARTLDLSTGNLNDFLQTDTKVWEQANVIRHRFGLKPLRDS
jgi:hypothetical protein